MEELGGGVGLNLFADFRVAVAEFQGTTFVNLGFT